MSEIFWLAALVILLSVGAALFRALRGPERADRIMSIQIIGTGSTGIIVLMAAARGQPSYLDIALVIAVLAAVPAIAFVKSVTAEGAGDPEREDKTP